MNNALSSAFYRETARQSGIGEAKVVRQTDGLAVYAHVQVSVSPSIRGQGNILSWNAGANIPTNFVPAVVQAVRESMTSGVHAGLEMIDVHVSVEDGSWHKQDSNAGAFKEATEEALEKALRQAQRFTLEAVSLVSVAFRTELMATVMAAMSSRGKVNGFDATGEVLTADIPTSQVDGLIMQLLEVSGGGVKVTRSDLAYRPRPEPPDVLEQWVLRS